VAERVGTIAGASTWWDETGPADAPTLVLVHGFRGDHHGLQRIAALLPEFRIISPDLPGFGHSEPIPRRHTIQAYADWLIEFASAVTDGPFAVLGHSFGSIVVSAALERGLAPERVILVNAIAAPALRGPKAIGSLATLGYYRLAAALPERAGRSLLSAPLIVRIMSIAMARTKDRELKRWIHEEHDRYFSGFATRDSVLEAFQASISDDVSRHVAGFTMPTLLIIAAQDQITSLEDSLALAARIPNASRIVLDGVGHLIHYERAPEAAEAIRAFMAADA